MDKGGGKKRRPILPRPKRRRRKVCVRTGKGARLRTENRVFLHLSGPLLYEGGRQRGEAQNEAQNNPLRGQRRGKKHPGALLGGEDQLPVYRYRGLLFQKELEYPCGAQRTRKEAENLLPADIEECGSLVSAAVKGDFGREAKALFTHEALVRTPGEL